MAFELRFSDKEVTAWGGLAVMKQMLDHLDFASALKQAHLPQPGSNRGYRPEQLIMQFIVSFWCGANRFAHNEMTRYDAALGQLFGFAKMANHQAITRLFQRFNQPDIDRVFDHLYSWLFAQITLVRLTLDLDSTVMTRYGIQQGAAVGYNPAKRGRASHHPLMAFISETNMMANFWLRPGNTGSANNVLAFFDSTLAHLGNKIIGLVRADSGFAEAGFMQKLEANKTPYIITLKLNQPLQRALMRASTWVRLEKGLDLVSIEYQAPSWKHPRRVIGIRQHISIRVDAKGKTLSLFADDPIIKNYRYSALVTTLTVSPVDVWRTYRGRADCENRIKELKYDFGADSFCLRHFWATEAALNTVMIGYNLMSLFRQAAADQGMHKDRDGDGGSDGDGEANKRGIDAVENTENQSDNQASTTQPTQTEKHAKAARKLRKKRGQSRLSTLRFKLFAKPGFFTTEGRKTILNLAIAVVHRAWFEGVWNKAQSFTIPVAFKPAFSP